MKKKCLICGNDFETRSGTSKYCGEDCRLQAKRNQSREYQRKKEEEWRKQNTPVCEYCGSPFPTDDWRKKYCSDECRKNASKIKAKERYEKNLSSEGRKGNILRICPNCGKAYHPFTYEDGHYTGMFCCITCCVEWRERHKNKPMYVTPEFIQLVERRERGEVTLKEMAETFDIPIGTVVSRMRGYQNWKDGQFHEV